jgi:hypothetical protein
MSGDFLQGENLRSTIGRRRRFCTVFSWSRRFWRSWTSGAVLVVLVLLLQEIDHYSGTSLFCISYFFLLVVCILSAARALYY